MRLFDLGPRSRRAPAATVLMCAIAMWSPGREVRAGAGPGAVPAGEQTTDPEIAGEATATTLVLPPRWEGESSAAQRDALAAGFTSALRESGVDASLDDGVACTTPTCRIQRATAVGAAFTIEMLVTVVDRDYVVSASLRDDDDELLAEASGRCPICGLADAVTLVSDQGTAIARKLRTIDATATVVLSSDPAGARVFVDGAAVGATPLRVRLTAGEHDITFEHEARSSVHRRVALIAGVRERLAVTLPAAVVPAPRTVPTRPPPPPLPVRGRGAVAGGATLLGAGLVGLGISVPLFILHGSVLTSRCEGLDVDFAGTCRFVRNTRPGAISAAVLGAAAVAGGIALIVRGKRAARASRARRPR